MYRHRHCVIKHAKRYDTWGNFELFTFIHGRKLEITENTFIMYAFRDMKCHNQYLLGLPLAHAI